VKEEKPCRLEKPRGGTIMEGALSSPQLPLIECDESNITSRDQSVRHWNC
jgi:hypothetical protein